jgi:hypothetical protein
MHLSGGAAFAVILAMGVAAVVLLGKLGML